MNAQGGIKIGDDVIVGPNTSFLAENHVFSDPMIPIENEECLAKESLLVQTHG